MQKACQQCAIKEITGRWKRWECGCRLWLCGGGWRWMEREKEPWGGRGRAGWAADVATSLWLTELQASGSICGQQQQRRWGGEEHLIHFFFICPCGFFTGAGRTKGGTDCTITGAGSASSRLQQLQLAWCSVQPAASLCGRAVHASKDPLSNPGLGEASALFLSFLFFVSSWQSAERYSTSG